MTPRWLVIFHSHPEPPFDATVVDVRAENQLAAIAWARQEMPPQHPWSFVIALKWPKDCEDVDEAIARLETA